MSADDKAMVFAELIQFIDDKSLSLIMREANDDGEKALKILREHYRSTRTRRIISLYTVLTCLKKTAKEDITDYVIRAENSATGLKNAGELISDNLLTAMILKGLPVDYQTFTAVITQKEKPMTFSYFKVALRSFEENIKINTEGDTVLTTRAAAVGVGDIPANRQPPVTCYGCGGQGHLRRNCNQKPRRWCQVCASNTHDAKFCRRRDHVKIISAENDDFVFKVSSTAERVHIDDFENDCSNVYVVNSLLVDCGATTHIVNDRNNFVSFNEKFDMSRHCIELADGSSLNGIVKQKGTACVPLVDSKGISRNVLLENALLVPSFSQNIFSVQAAAQK